MKIYEKLLSIQTQLKAPKGQFNNFGKYKYRNCEDILESVKPLCKENGAVLWLTDDLVMIGDRYYVKATATLKDTSGDGEVQSIAFAREEESKKGMDGSQVTGASSSYARKYALNALFDIDDTKDSDTTNIPDTHQSEGSTLQPVLDKVDFSKQLTPMVTCENCKAVISAYIDSNGKKTGVDKVVALSKERFNKVLCVDCARKQSKHEN